MPALKDALSGLTNIAQQLNEESDSVNELIATVEDAINQAKPGVEAWLSTYVEHEIASSTRYDEDRGCDVRSYWVIGYGPAGGENWGILARQDEVDAKEENPTPRLISFVKSLSACPRNIRIDAAPLLEVLVYQVRERAEEMLNSLREAKGKVE